ncbi:MAG: pantetheine-phosphate adenylyltransferase [Promethearchaeota archaeon]
MIYNVCGLGGTFDHLHEGHKFLLETAFKLGKKVVVGLATDKLLANKKYREILEPYNVRAENIKEFARKLDPEHPERLEIIPLNDPFGPAIIYPNIDIHVSSEESYKNAIKINQMREERGLKKMILVIIPLVKNKEGRKVSSADLREKLAKESQS